MKKSSLISSVGAAAILSACVTINIYFPAAAAEKAADKIIDEVWQLKDGYKPEAHQMLKNLLKRLLNKGLKTTNMKKLLLSFMLIDEYVRCQFACCRCGRFRGEHASNFCA